MQSSHVYYLEAIYPAFYKSNSILSPSWPFNIAPLTLESSFLFLNNLSSNSQSLSFVLYALKFFKDFDESTICMQCQWDTRTKMKGIMQILHTLLLLDYHCWLFLPSSSSTSSLQQFRISCSELFSKQPTLLLQ